MNKKRVINIILIILWLGIIFFFSNQSNSNASTYGSVKDVVNFLGFNLSRDTIRTINFIIRKLAHMTEFFVLTIIILTFLKNFIKSDKKLFILGFIFCVLFASLDEFHQSFVPGRSSMIFDVVIDTFGGLLAILIYNLFYKRKIGETNE